MFNPCCCSTFTCIGCLEGTEIVGGWEIEIDGIAAGSPDCGNCTGYNGLYYLDDFDGTMTPEGDGYCVMCSETPQSVIDDTTNRPSWSGAVGCDGWVWVPPGGPFTPGYWYYRWHQVCIRTYTPGGASPDAYVKVTFKVFNGNSTLPGTVMYANLFAFIGSDAQDSRYNPIDCNLIDYDLTLEGQAANECNFSATVGHVRAL